MKWLPDHPQKQAAPAPQRFVLTKLEAAASATTGNTRRQAGQLVDGNEPVCTIVSNDAQLIERCAVIAVGAAVRIEQCTDPQQLPATGTGPVLWGSDAATLAAGAGHRVDVLVGTETDAAVLWSLASQNPKARVALLPTAAKWLGEYLGLWAMRAGHGHTLALGATAGGVGTTTLALLAAHAGTLSGLRSAVIDLDPHSTGLWPLACDRPPSGIGWEELQDSGGTLAAHQLAETLPQLHGTAVLTWAQPAAHAAVEDQLVIRLLAAARQGFDLLVLDTGRTWHPQRAVLDQFIDRMVLSCSAASLPDRGEAVLCGQRKLPGPPAEGTDIIGAFPPMPRIAKAAARGELFESFKSRALRQALANLRLLPQLQERLP